MHVDKHLLIAVTAIVAAAAPAAPAMAHTPQQVTGNIQNGTLTVTGTNASDAIGLALVAGDPTRLAVSGGRTVATFDRSQFSSIVVNAGDGDDVVQIDESHGVFTDTDVTTLRGQGGNDTLEGGSGNETLDGGAGNDQIDGKRGADVALMGAGNDTFQWDPGDASDVVEGQGGDDTMLFNGSNADEKIDLSAIGQRLRFTRDVASITMDVDGVENVEVNTLGGADTVTVNDLAGTAVRTVETNLAASSGSGDGQPDAVVVDGTDAPDTFKVASAAGETDLTGPAARVVVTNAEPADSLVVNGLGSDDRLVSQPGSAPLIESFNGGDGVDTTIAEGTYANDDLQIADDNNTAVDVSGGGAGFVRSSTENLLVAGLGGDDTIIGGNGLSTLTALTIDGGPGDDTIHGGDGNDLLIGGSGNDQVDGGRGADTALMGGGDDAFQWDPGDGSDVVEGQGGHDTMLFNGSNANENISLSANGRRLLLTRDVAAITMDTAGVENVAVNTLGGSDTLTVNDLGGTGVKSVEADLAASGGVGDQAADTVVVNGTDGNDHVAVTGSAGSALVNGLAASVAISGAEVPGDTLAINVLGGNDVVDASALAADAIQLAVDGGTGNDRLIGGAGNDTLLGNDGNDSLFGGPGVDVLDGGSGNNIVVQD